MSRQRVLVTGGTGFIGSHIVVALCKTNRFIVDVLDSGVNSNFEQTETALRGICPEDTLGEFYKIDLLGWHYSRADRILEDVDVVIHCAGWKSVNESAEKPLDYYQNNVVGTLILLEAMRRCRVNSIVFSSSATVYGSPKTLPITENSPIRPTNPYGQTKAMAEQIIRDLCASSARVSENVFNACILRYFNPCGCHESALIGEEPRGVPNNLQPYVAQVAHGERPFLNIFGNNWPTADGTPIRDYIHVEDLARAHVSAVDFLLTSPSAVCETINIGTGQGYSVMEMVRAFEVASGKTIPCVIAERRAGDVAAVYADPSKAHRLLHWQSEKTLHEMCADAWRFINHRKENLKVSDKKTSAPSAKASIDACLEIILH